MRTAFIKQLQIEARSNKNLFLIVGDLGYSVVESFASEFPDRYLNVGVAEQNMTGVAAGLASEGWHVFTYSIANFPTLRCLEQIRNDICYHKFPVTVVSIGAGVSYGNLGYSHHAVQDLAIMRALGDMVVLSPADPGEARESVRWLAANPGPSYLRLGKAGEPELYKMTSEISAEPICVRASVGDTAIVASGSILKVALESADICALQGHSVAVYSVPWIHPLDGPSLNDLTRFSSIFALEEHVSAGGLASCLREHLPPATVVESCALPLNVLRQVGSQNYLRKAAGLSADLLAARVMNGICR